MNIVRSRGALVGFAMVCATLAANALISYLNVRRLHENGLAIQRTHESRLALATLRQLLVDAETGQRGYLITGEASYLEPYREAITQVEAVLSQLGESFRGEAAQRENYVALERHTRRVVNLIHQSVITRQRQGLEASRQEALTGAGKVAMDEARIAIEQLDRAQQRRLTERTEDSRFNFRTAVLTGIIALLMGLGLAATGYWLVRRELLSRFRAQRELEALNAGLESRVRERTQAISDANAALRTEIETRQRAEELAQRSAAELQISNRALEQFASVASHDLQEPLRKIQAFGDRLQTGYRDQLGERGGDYLDRMCAAATRMRKLIDDLLCYSRVARRSQPFQPVDLQQVAREVLDDLDERVQQTGGHVDVGPLPTLPADPLQMRQLFQNLLANGLKFHRPNVPPRIEVTAERIAPANGDGRDSQAQSPERWQVTFADNGVGFEQTYAERIFDLFQRLHSRQDYEGTGMGLAICKRIAERHGGTIAAQGFPGQGSRFVVTLPVENAPQRENS